MRRTVSLRGMVGNGRFWLIIAALAFLSFLHYVEELHLGGTALPSYHFGLVRHSIDRILFLVPMAYAGFIFGLWIGLAIGLVSLLIMLPRALLLSSSIPDATLESVGVFIVGGLLCLLLETRREKQQRLLTTVELETVQQDIQSRIRLLRSNEKRLATLNAISSLLSRSLDVERVLRNALDMVMEVMEVEVALLFLVDEKAQELRLIAHEGVSERFAQEVSTLKVGEGFNGRVASTGEPEIVENASEDPRLSKQIVKQERIEAQLIVPLKARGLTIGTLCVANRRPRRFLPEEVELLMAIGGQVGITIENARLYQAQQLLTEQYRGIFENASDAIWVHDLEGNILTANQASAKLTGYSKEELCSMNVSQFLSKEGLEKSREVRKKLLRGESLDGPYDQRLTRKDGTEALFRLTSSLVMKDGKPVGFQHVARDVTEEQRMEDNLRFYLREITRAQEEERKRLARELHDETAQRLVAISHQLENLASDDTQLSEADIQQLTKLREQVKYALEEVRHFSRDLRPSLLDDLGLLPAVEWLTSDLTEKTGIKAELKVTGAERRFSPEAELLLFRIAQEALNNVRRHAEASRVQVSIGLSADKIVLTVQDDGKGFEMPKQVGELSRMGKLGLVGMEERTRLLGGTLNVQSELGKGTTIIVEAPYNLLTSSNSSVKQTPA